VGAAVYFWRTFELTGAPAGWTVSLDARLVGRGWVDGDSRRDALRFFASGLVRIVEGQFDRYLSKPRATATITHTTDLGSHEGYGWPGLSVGVSRADNQLIPDGTYTVMGALRISTESEFECYYCFGTGYTEFFNPPGLVANVDATPA
jgi:hypothetical protein